MDNSSYEHKKHIPAVLSVFPEDEEPEELEGLFSSDSATISEQFLTWIASLEEEGYEPIDILAGMNFAFCDLLCKMQE